VILSGIDGLNNNSTENALGERPSESNNLEATLANKSTSELLDLEMELILKERNIRTQPAPAPSRDLDSSKYKD
jgi:hypothetical protein